MTTYASEFAKLNAAQKKAVTTIDGPVLVIAGPGTGKTQLLALRAAHILEKTDVLPQNILCLTYTEAAARNMRERLSRFIGKQAYDVRMSTYHGFGSEIIRSYGEYFPEQIADTAIDSLGQNQILHDIFDTLPTSNPLWRKEVYLRDALGFISEAKRAMLQPDDIRSIATDNERSIATLSALTKQHLAGLVKMSPKAIPLFESLFLACQKSLEERSLPSGLLPLDQQFTTALAEAMIAAHQTGKSNTLTAFKTAWLSKNDADEWVVKGAKEVQKISGAADIYEQYLAKLTAAHMFDYDDMILRAIHGLQANNELRFSLQEQYQYIMLDEFQDTNLAQLKLIELLTNNPVSNGRPNVLAVGDDDQAIFSFQGADLTNMLRFSTMYRDVATITLTENWRSHHDILQTAQFVSGQIEERLHNRLGFSEKLLIAKNPKLPATAKLERHEFISDIAELDWVAQEIASLIKQGVPASEITVLAPKHKYLEPLVPYLLDKGAPIAYDKRENIFDDPHISSLITAARLVLALHARDNGAANALWPIVLSGSEWSVPTSTIWQLSWQTDKNRYVDNAVTDWLPLMLNDPSLKPIALFFARLGFLAQTESLENMLDYLTGVTALDLNEPGMDPFFAPFYSYYFDKKSQQANPELFSQLLSHLTVLRQHLRNYKADQESPLLLGDFVDFVDAYAKANEKLLNTSPYHTGQEAVQLLTAFGAKGLEFDVVFVIGALDEIWGMKARGATSNIGLPQNMQIIRRAGMSKDERKRLFYVALTRAKHTLYLTSFTHNYSGKQMSRLEFLDEAESDGIVTSNALAVGNNIVKQSDHSAPEIASLRHFWQTRHVQGIAQPDLKELIRPRLESFQLSATHLNTFTDLVYGGPEQFFMNSILKFPKAPSADGQYGNAMHETMDAVHHKIKADGELPELEEITSIFTQRLRKKRLTAAEFTRHNDRGIRALEVFIPHWWPNFNPANRSEESFKEEGVFVGEAHLTGNLDHLLIDHQNNSMLVVDFKTGKPHAAWAKEPKLHKYRQQLLFYKILVEGSHTYGKYLVEQGRLVFVEPNDDGKIDELSLDYTHKEVERTKRLIEAVWSLIMALDFPDVSGFSKDYKGILEFEDWLISDS